MNSMPRLIQVYKSSRREEMYLYVEKNKKLEELPEVLLTQFGEPESLMLLPLKADSKLARADAARVLADIDEQGFYLQMPPTPAELLRREGQT